MSKPKNEINIESILIAVFGPKPSGGGGRVGRWSAMRSLLRYVLEAPDHTVFLNDILYDWSAHEGLTPGKTQELLEHICSMAGKKGLGILKIIGDSPKTVEWVGI